MEYPEEWNELPKRERKKKIRALKAQDVSKSSLIGRIRNWSIDLIIAVLLIGGIYYWSTNREILPPTDMAGHIEQNPSSHVMDEPMSLSVQKHMLEHSDGKGPPGVIINYNCEDFECEPGLKEKLAEIANKYSEFAFKAPFSNMSKKIAITRMGKIQTFDNLDKNALVQFIEGK